MKRHAKVIVAISALLLTLALGVTFAGAVAPTVTIENASDVSYATAKVKGTVNPGDHDTTYRFEYSPDSNFNGSSSAGEDTLVAGAGSQSVDAELIGLKPGTTYFLRLVAENADGTTQVRAASTFKTKEVQLPVVSIDQPSAVTTTGAHFSGTIEPNAPEGNPAFDVTYRFVCSPECPGLQGNRLIPADDASHPVADDTTGLAPNTEYRVRLLASNAAGAREPSVCFRTTPVSPQATALPIGPVTDTTAVLGGWIDPNGSQATYYAEYATQPDFSDAQSFPPTEDASAGSCNKYPASLLVNDFEPDTEYFYRLVTHSDAGDHTSAAQIFRTYAPAPPIDQDCPNAQFRTGPSASLPECRAFERVTPSDKNGGDAKAGLVLDNDRVSFGINATLLDDDPFYDGVGRYIAVRHPGSGWKLRSALLGTGTIVADVSDDDSRDVILQKCSGSSFFPCPKLLPADTDVAADVYVRTSAGLSLASTGSLGGNGEELNASYQGQSSDGQHILFTTSEPLEPGHSAGRQLYERVGSKTNLVGVLPGGTVDPGGAILGDQRLGKRVPAADTNAVSEDGSILFFESPDPDADGDGVTDANAQLYARVDASETIQVSASQCDPACGPSKPAVFWGAGTDGNLVYFTTTSRLLPADSDDAPDLYQFRMADHRLRLITQNCLDQTGASVDCGWAFDFTEDSGLNPGREGFGVVGVSDDGRRIYFGAPPAPAGEYGGVVKSSLWVYDESDGSARFVVPVGGDGVESLFSNGNGGVEVSLPLQAQMAADGSHLLFESVLRLTAFNNAGTGQLYRYQLDSGSVDCVSCNSSGEIPSGSVAVHSALRAAGGGETLSAYATLRHPTALASADGHSVLFQSPNALVPQDTNGSTDVYLWSDGRFFPLSGVTKGGDESQGIGPTSLMGITPDGKDAFFRTDAKLVPSDLDEQVDIYTARVGGGLASDYPTMPPAGCAGESCRSVPTQPSTGSVPSTAAFAGPGNPQNRCRKGKVRRGNRCVRKRTSKRKTGNKTGRKHGGRR